MKALTRPIMGTGLTVGGAVAILAAMPAFWSVFALVFVAMPS
ncbi:hypothetical protein [Sphingomonas sp. AAP5]|nr:hypothetical protein [Sphingomonas sp. AAP5]